MRSCMLKPNDLPKRSTLVKTPSMISWRGGGLYISKISIQNDRSMGWFVQVMSVLIAPWLFE